MAIRRLGLVVALAVAACAAPPPSAKTAVVPGGAPAGSAGRELPGESTKAAPRPLGGPMLVGLASRDVEGMLGRPRFVRRDGPAQIWQYGTDRCTLNVYFYREGTALTVRHAEFRERSADLVMSGGCEGAMVSMVQPKAL